MYFVRWSARSGKCFRIFAIARVTACPTAFRARSSLEPASRMRPPSPVAVVDRKSTRLNSSHLVISYAVFCLNNKHGKVITPAHPIRARPFSSHAKLLHLVLEFYLCSACHILQRRHVRYHSHDITLYTACGLA